MGPRLADPCLRRQPRLAPTISTVRRAPPATRVPAGAWTHATRGEAIVGPSPCTEFPCCWAEIALSVRFGTSGRFCYSPPRSRSGAGGDRSALGRVPDAGEVRPPGTLPSIHANSGSDRLSPRDSGVGFSNGPAGIARPGLIGLSVLGSGSGGCAPDEQSL